MSKLLIGGSWVDGESSQPLRDKYAGAVYGEMAVASAAQVEAAVSGAVAGQQASKLAPYELYKILSKAAVILESRIELLVELMRVEAGFTRADRTYLAGDSYPVAQGKLLGPIPIVEKMGRQIRKPGN